LLNDSKQLYQKNVCGREIQKPLTAKNAEFTEERAVVDSSATFAALLCDLAVKGFLFD
jgi:hypothetical protein